MTIKQPIQYGQLDPQQRLDVARGTDHDTKDCTRLPVVTGDIAAYLEGLVYKDSTRRFFVGLHCDTDCTSLIAQAGARMAADAQALIAELRAENERQDDAYALLSLDAGRKMDELEREIAELKAQLQAAPAERGVVLPDVNELSNLIRYIPKWHSIGAGRLAEAICERLNPAPATAENSALAGVVMHDSRLKEDAYEHGQSIRIDAWRQHATLGYWTARLVTDDKTDMMATAPSEREAILSVMDMFVSGSGAGKAKPPATAEQAWIPVSERLPKQGTPVDLWRGNERLPNYRLVKDFAGKIGNTFFEPVESGFSCVRDATHWMPRPAEPATADSDVREVNHEEL